jgi:proton-dependent oligopeptide transporter, POT family
MWKKLHEKQMLSARSIQFALGLAITALALQVLVIGIHLSKGNLVNPHWIVLCYLLITIGELMLSPIGLSMVTQLAPVKFLGLMMGVWFIGLSYGGLLAGYMGKQASIPKELISNIAQTNVIYAHAFQHYALFGFVAAFITLLMTPWINRLTRR